MPAQQTGMWVLYLQHRWLLCGDAHGFVQLWLGDGATLDHGCGNGGGPLFVCSEIKLIVSDLSSWESGQSTGARESTTRQ